MTQEARVRKDYRIPAVTAFGGREFVKTEWRLVPEGQGGSAAAHPFLELREVGAPDGVDGVDGVDAVDAVETRKEKPAAAVVVEPAAPPAPPAKKEERKGKL